MGNIGELQTKAKEIRKLIIRSIGQARSGHPGGSLSCADLIAALYFDIMDIDPGNPSGRTGTVLCFPRDMRALRCTRRWR